MANKGNLLNNAVIFMGSGSGEDEASVQTAEFLSKYLSQSQMNINVPIIKVTAENAIDKINETKPSLVFNAMHGVFGEDGQLQKLLDYYQIPYTGSNAVASMLGFNKTLSKNIFRRNRIPVPSGIEFAAREIYNGNIDKIIRNACKVGKLNGGQFVIKPCLGGSSLGVFMFDINKPYSHNKHAANEAIKQDVFGVNDVFICEERIVGREFDVIVIDSHNKTEIVGLTEVDCRGEIYNYEEKYDPKSKFSKNLNPQLPEEIKTLIMEYGLKMHKLVKCKDASRSEFMVRTNKSGGLEVFALEINTHPGFRDESLTILIANKNGITSPMFMENLVANAQFSQY